MEETRCTIVDDDKAENLANKWNVSFVKKFWQGKEQFYIHGHFKTISETKLEAINKYLD